MRARPAELSQGIELIRSGAVDAQENPLANTAAYGVDHRFVTLTGHLYGARVLLANPDHSSDMIRSGAAAAISYQRREAARYEEELLTRFVAEGRDLVELSSVERQAFIDAAVDVIAPGRAGLE